MVIISLWGQCSFGVSAQAYWPGACMLRASEIAYSVSLMVLKGIRYAVETC